MKCNLHKIPRPKQSDVAAFSQITACNLMNLPAGVLPNLLRTHPLFSFHRLLPHGHDAYQVTLTFLAATPRVRHLSFPPLAYDVSDLLGLNLM